MYINVQGKKVNYVKKGSGDRQILLVHGWGGSVQSLSGLQDLLAQNFEVYAIDLPGFGESENPENDWGVEEYAACVLEFSERLGLSNAVYFGHSFGGALGVFLAASDAVPFEKFVFAAPSYNRSRAVGKKTFFSRLNQKFENCRLWKFFRSVVYRVFFPQSDLLKYPHLKSNFKKIVAYDLTPLTSEIKKDSLILWGDKDSYVPVEDAYLLNEKIVGSKLLIYKGAAHGFPLKNPKRVYQDVTEFLR